MLIEIEQPEHGIVPFTILHHLSALFTFVLVVWGLTVGAFTVFLVRPDATRQNDSAFQCAGLACQVGRLVSKYWI